MFEWPLFKYKILFCDLLVIKAWDCSTIVTSCWRVCNFTITCNLSNFCFVDLILDSSLGMSCLLTLAVAPLLFPCFGAVARGLLVGMLGQKALMTVLKAEGLLVLLVPCVIVVVWIVSVSGLRVLKLCVMFSGSSSSTVAISASVAEPELKVSPLTV